MTTTLAGAAVPLPGQRLATVSIFEKAGELPDRPIDEPLVAAWTVDVAELSDARIQSAGTLPPVEYGAEVLYVLDDVDGSGSASDGDLPAGVVCGGVWPVTLLWLTPTTNAATAFTYGVYGIHGGWTLVSGLDADPIVLDAEAADLEVFPTEACR
jgi:hypothetical protein